MLSLFACNQYNTQSIEVSYFDNSTMRIQLWELNAYETFNFPQPLTFFNLTIKYTIDLEKSDIIFFS